MSVNQIDLWVLYNTCQNSVTREEKIIKIYDKQSHISMISLKWNSTLITYIIYICSESFINFLL